MAGWRAKKRDGGGMSDDTFTCDMCGGTFNKGRTDEEADAEAAAIFGDAPPPEGRSIVCEDCWIKLINGGFLKQDWPMGNA